MHSRPRIAWSILSTLNTRISQNAGRPCSSNVRLLNDRTKTTKDETEKEVLGGYDVAALLVAALGILLGVLGHADHLGDANSIEASECL